ncbi:MAG: helix-turn-helix domain-containing protein, partial [Lachnospiraceae bacterium]|nr:helix-turn-helix domain-containing protein [Lachnospiraceae bacterium]
INKDSRNKEKQNTDLQSTDSFPSPSSPPMTTNSATVSQPEMKGRKRTGRRRVSQDEMDSYREMIRENIRYDDFVRERPYDVSQLDEMIELMVEAVCSRKETIRVAGNDFPQVVVKSRLLKLDGEHIRFVFDCLRENTTQVRNMKQYLLTVLYNAPATIENHYAAQVNHDFYGSKAA